MGAILFVIRPWYLLFKGNKWHPFYTYFLFVISVFPLNFLAWRTQTHLWSFAFQELMQNLNLSSMILMSIDSWVGGFLITIVWASIPYEYVRNILPWWLACWFFFSWLHFNQHRLVWIIAMLGACTYLFIATSELLTSFFGKEVVTFINVETANELTVSIPFMVLQQKYELAVLPICFF